MDEDGRRVLRAILNDWKDGTLMLEEAAHQMAARAAAALGEAIQERHMEKAPFEGWAILELMGHRRLAGYVSEQEIAGVVMLRIDVPGEDGGDGQVAATQFYGGASIYCLTPTTEEIAKKVARGAQPAPVQRWELREERALPAATVPPHHLEGDDEGEDEDF